MYLFTYVFNVKVLVVNTEYPSQGLKLSIHSSITFSEKIAHYQ